MAHTASKVTAGGAFLVFVAAINGAGSLGQLGHNTSGHILLGFGGVLAVISFALFLLDRSQAKDERSLKVIPQSAPSSSRSLAPEPNLEQTVTQAPPDNAPDETSCRILGLLFNRGALHIRDLEVNMDMPREEVKFHLEILQRAGYVHFEANMIPAHERYSLKQKGRELAIKDKLATSPQAAPDPNLADPRLLVGGMGGLPFPAGPPPWAEYTEDMIAGVIWRWHYNLEFDNKPRGLEPFCPECRARLTGSKYVDGRTGGYAVHLACSAHSTVTCGRDDDFAPIKALIQKRIDDGSYDAIVTRQRIQRGY